MFNSGYFNACCININICSVFSSHTDWTGKHQQRTQTVNSLPLRASKCELVCRICGRKWSKTSQQWISMHLIIDAIFYILDAKVKTQRLWWNTAKTQTFKEYYWSKLWMWSTCMVSKQGQWQMCPIPTVCLSLRQYWDRVQNGPLRSLSQYPALARWDT